MVFLLCLGLPVFGQSIDGSNEEITAANSGAPIAASSEDASPNIMLARSSADYQVTPGDVYTLSYAAGSSPVLYTIAVDSSYRVRVSNLGIINGAGKTFMQLKREVEATVANNYPLSGVQLVLTQPAVFRVFVTGEVYQSGEIAVWALRRLSSLAGGNLSSYASVRDVTVKSSNGQTRSYDLFKARRLGDLSQDPYLRPGDVITFNRVKRAVTINGAVERPGTYQLLDEENLRQLITVYGNGFTPVADKTRGRLVRYIGSKEISGDIILLSEEELNGDYVLRDMDVLSIPSITALRPAVPVNRKERTITIAGAVRRPGTYELMPNENLQELLSVYADGYTPLADKTRVTLRRYVGSGEISGEITYLSEAELAGNYALEHLDTITVPDISELRPAAYTNRLERSITIAGAVRRPGSYNLLQAENLKELIEVYADGFTPLADKTRVTLRRYVGSSEISGDITILAEADLNGNYPLEHLDMITVPDISELRPAAYVNRIERTITLEGAVRRPGTYELMPNENLKELIEIYGDGFTAIADPTRIEIERIVNSTDVSGEKIYLTENDIEANFRLEHYDIITIPSISQLRPVVFVEGAVASSSDSTELDSSNRIVMQFSPGETYATMVRAHTDWFTAVSDTQNAYILRKEERIPLNLNPILYDASWHNEVLIEADDVLVIPFRQYFVSVAGAVMNPGRYPYIPDRNWEYYIGLAGGFLPERNAAQMITIIDLTGKRLRKNSPITPETTITASTNHILYYINLWAPIVTTLLGLATTAFSIYAATR